MAFSLLIALCVQWYVHDVCTICAALCQKIPINGTGEKLRSCVAGAYKSQNAPWCTYELLCLSHFELHLSE